MAVSGNARNIKIGNKKRKIGHWWGSAVTSHCYPNRPGMDAGCLNGVFSTVLVYYNLQAHSVSCISTYTRVTYS